MKNYYKILEVSFDSDLNTIKKAYRQLALKYHPDKNKSSNAQDMFIVITEAYEILCNESTRIEYDILYAKYFIKKEELSMENINTCKDWEERGYAKGEEYAKKKYDEFINILNKIMFHTSNYARIGCLGGGLMFIGVIWMIAPFIVLASANSNDVAGPAIFSFLMGIGALYAGNKKIKEMNKEYKIKKSNYKNK